MKELMGIFILATWYIGSVLWCRYELKAAYYTDIFDGGEIGLIDIIITFIPIVNFICGIYLYCSRTKFGVIIAKKYFGIK